MKKREDLKRSAQSLLVEVRELERELRCIADGHVRDDDDVRDAIFFTGMVLNVLDDCRGTLTAARQLALDEFVADWGEYAADPWPG